MRISILDREFELEIVFTHSARASAYVKDQLIKMRVPAWLPEVEKHRLVSEMEQMIEKKLQRNPNAFMSIKEPHFYEGQDISVLGSHFKIRIKEDLGSSRSRAYLKDGEVVVVLAQGISGKFREHTVSVLCRGIIAKAVMPSLAEKVEFLNRTHFNFDLGKVSIRQASSRWGSCNAKTKRINLNFLLLFAPERVLDYVIIHELAHLKESNHSKAFWALVQSAMPDYKEVRTWLRRNGSSIGPV